MKQVDHYCVQYAQWCIKHRADMGMSTRRLRDYLRACIDLWRRTYGDQPANAAETAIKAAWTTTTEKP
jgi:hypothetical protein